MKPSVEWGRGRESQEQVEQSWGARELQGERAAEGQDLPYRGPAAAPGRQRTPASRAWSWPRCGPATGVLGALRAMGRVLQETQTLQAVGEAHGSQFTHTLPAHALCGDPRPTGDTLCWQGNLPPPQKGLRQGRWRGARSTGSTGWRDQEQPGEGLACYNSVPSPHRTAPGGLRAGRRPEACCTEWASRERVLALQSLLGQGS